MPDRFYCPDLTAASPVRLTDTEAHHLKNVLRAEVGETVELFNGRGGVAEAVITRIDRREIELRVPTFRQEPPPACRVILATAVPKGDRMKWLVEKATELGVGEIIPLTTARSVVIPRDSKLEKMEQTVIAACKQCRRSRLLELREPTAWSELLRSPSGPLWLAHPGGQSPRELSPPHETPAITVAIGPEGGFTGDEVSQARDAGAVTVNLGPRILRTETAGMLLAGWAVLLAEG